MVFTASEFSVALDEARSAGHSVGLVPTMGALHDGHRSLVERASGECECVAVTIFVNPLQFDDPADLDAYPRDLGADLELLSDAGADIVFVPDVSELYPDHPAAPATTVHVAGVSDVLEGKFRPGHFDGVATVVTKLFAMAGRCTAYFGEKDFQQVAVVRRLVRDLCMPVHVVACPTVREPHGLASVEPQRAPRRGPRRRAAVINRALVAGAAAVADGEDDPGHVRDAMQRVLAQEPSVEPEYAEVVDALSMSTPEKLSGEVRLLIAARVGNVRLIDNLGAVVGVEVGDVPAAAMSTTP